MAQPRPICCEINAVGGGDLPADLRLGDIESLLLPLCAAQRLVAIEQRLKEVQRVLRAIPANQRKPTKTNQNQRKPAGRAPENVHRPKPSKQKQPKPTETSRQTTPKPSKQKQPKPTKTNRNLSADHRKTCTNRIQPQSVIWYMANKDPLSCPQRLL